MAFSKDERHRLKITISQLYYIEDFTQTEIAAELGISRPTVIKLLKEAKKEGIVKIEITDPLSSEIHIDKEKQLRELLGIGRVIITDVSGKDAAATQESIGRAAAGYIDTLISSDMKIGIGWGKTMEFFAEYLPARPGIQNIEFVSLLGGIGTNADIKMYGNALCDKIASKYSGSIVHYMYAPMVASDLLTANAFHSSKAIQTIFEMVPFLDAAVIGIDSDIEHSTTINNSIKDGTGNISEEDIRELKQLNTAGNICAHFYDTDGNTIVNNLNSRVIGASPDDLKKIKNIIAIAGGEHKTESIISAARGGFFSTLITDIFTADSIIQTMTEQK